MWQIPSQMFVIFMCPRELLRNCLNLELQAFETLWYLLQCVLYPPFGLFETLLFVVSQQNSIQVLWKVKSDLLIGAERVTPLLGCDCIVMRTWHVLCLLLASFAFRLCVHHAILEKIILIDALKVLMKSCRFWRWKTGPQRQVEHERDIERIHE